MISNLPQDLITEILARLPVKSVGRLLCVSKEWYALFTGSDFIKVHFKSSIETNRDRTVILNEGDFYPHVHHFSAVQFSKYNRFGKAVAFYQPLKNWVISDFCDGLVCLHKDHEKQEVAIWNPLVRKYRKFPIEPIEEPSGFTSGIRFSHLAFGRDPRNDDYKVLRATEFYMTDSRMEFEVKVCSMRSRSWKKIEEQWPNVEITSRKLVALNGDVYWLATDRVVHDLKLLAFSLATEKLRLCGTPVPPDDNLFTCLDVLGGLLCFITNDYMYCDVYLMKKYGVESSWTQIFKIRKSLLCLKFEYFRTLVFSTNGKKVLLEAHQEGGLTNLIWYDIEKKRCYRVKKNQDFPFAFKAATCIGSLLLLDGDNVFDPAQKKIKRKRKRY